MGVNIGNIKRARKRISNFLRCTPVADLSKIYSDRTDFLKGAHLFAKLETMQATGSFKVRGALNKVLCEIERDNGQKPKMLIAASGGNHAVAVAFVGHLLGIKTRIFLGSSTPNFYIEKVRKWGAEINLCGNDFAQALKCSKKEYKEKGGCFIHPFDDSDVICGQGTLGLELLEQVTDMDKLFLAIGGGGLIGGVACAIKSINPNIKIIGVEPENAPTMTEALNNSKPTKLEHFASIAVTLSVAKTGNINLDLAEKYVDEIILVSENDIKRSCTFLWDEFAIASEYAGATALSALISGKHKDISGGDNIATIICGAGLDFLNQ